MERQARVPQSSGALDDLSLRQLRKASTIRQTEFDPDKKATLEYRGIELAGEAGEALNVIKKLLRERLGMPGSRSNRMQLAEELADVIICADLVAYHEGIDLAVAVRMKFNKTSQELGLKTCL